MGTNNKNSQFIITFYQQEKHFWTKESYVEFLAYSIFQVGWISVDINWQYNILNHQRVCH